jgi:hypothetical protein
MVPSPPASSKSKNYLTLLQPLKISGTTHKWTQHHIPDLLPQKHHLGKKILQDEKILLSAVPLDTVPVLRWSIVLKMFAEFP